jgi:hypothetical protein
MSNNQTAELIEELEGCLEHQQFLGNASLGLVLHRAITELSKPREGHSKFTNEELEGINHEFKILRGNEDSDSWDSIILKSATKPTLTPTEIANARIKWWGEQENPSEIQFTSITHRGDFHLLPSAKTTHYRTSPDSDWLPLPKVEGV